LVVVVGRFLGGRGGLGGGGARRRPRRKETADRNAANAHAWVMLAFSALSFCEILVRNIAYPDARHTPITALAMTIGLGGLAVLGGTLGGALTFEHGLSVETRQDITAQVSATQPPSHGAPIDPLDVAARAVAEETGATS